MNQLDKLMEELESKIPLQETINPWISKSCVGWHIEHALLTIDVIIEALKRSNPDDYKWTFSFIRILVFTTNRIPRGRAQSPISVQPKTDFNIETLKNHVYFSKQKIKELESLKSNNYFIHPFFGKLNVKPTIKFIGIHTRHHLHIINDILNKKKESPA